MASRPATGTQFGLGWALGLILAATVGCGSSASAPAGGASGYVGNGGGGIGTSGGIGTGGGSGTGAGIGTGGGIGIGGGIGAGGSSGPSGLGGGQDSGGGGAGGTGTGGNASVSAGTGGGGIGGAPGGSSGGASGAAGGSTNNAAAIETVEVGGGSVSLMTNLTQGALYLLKATGGVSVGDQMEDAEFASGPAGTGAMDSVNGTDVGIDVGLLEIHPPTGRNQVPPGPGRMKWYGSFRADHTYYMIVTGAGKPLTLKLVTSSAASSGEIAVSLFLLAPTPPATDKLTPGPLPPAPAAPNIGTKVLETVQVPAAKTTIKSAQAGASNAVYLLQASGAVRCGGGGLMLGDAEYDDWGTTGAGANNDDGPCDFGVGVDEASTNTCAGLRAHWWGPYRNDHIYFMLYAGTGNPISFLYFDSGYGDNTATDTITVGVFPAP